MSRLSQSQTIPRPIDEVFNFFAEPRNLTRITPPWLGFRIVSDGDLTMRVGLRIEYRVSPLGFPQRWVSEITEWNPPWSFVDEQRVGPYRHWHHTHRFRTVPAGTEVTDEVDYQLPFGPLGRLVSPWLVEPRLSKIFAYRSQVLAQLFGSA